jgi:hypothetical protein
MILFPYGNSNFHDLRTSGALYFDRSHYIPSLESAGKQLLFLRPRRFGKSLLLSMLANYYDINQTDDFYTLFGDLAIGQQPTAERNQYRYCGTGSGDVASGTAIASIGSGSITKYLVATTAISEGVGRKVP